MGKLIVIDGIDGTGKETQSKLLVDNLKKIGYNVKYISYPNYNSKYCNMIIDYLNGSFGNEPNEYAIMNMYALDRWTTYIKEWKDIYDNDGIIICDRYVPSMQIYSSTRKNIEYADTIHKLEYDLYNLPYPDLILYLNIDKDKNIELIDKRLNKINNSDKLDIIEKDKNFIIKLHNTVNDLIKKYNWDLVECMDDTNLKTINEIQNIILDKTMKVIGD